MSEDRLEKDMENAVRDFDRLVSCLEEIIDPETRAQLARTIIFVVQRIEEEYPDLIDSNFLYNKGDCYIELGQHEAARDVLQQAQKLDPDDPTILNNLGLGYIELGQHEAARDVYQQAQKLDPLLKQGSHPPRQRRICVRRSRRDCLGFFQRGVNRPFIFGYKFGTVTAPVWA